MTGLPNFQRPRPRKSPNASVNSFVGTDGFIGSELQFQQTDFEGERLLYVGVEQPLGLLQHRQIFPGLARVEAPGNFIRAGNRRQMQQFFAYGVCGIALLAGVYGSLYRRLRLLPRESERCILTSFLVFAIVRGFAEAEPFDLVLPIWLISTIAFLTESELQSNLRPHAIPVLEKNSLPSSAVEGDI